MFVPTGNMGNQVAIRTHVTMLGSRDVIQHNIVCDSRSHVFVHELGGVPFHTGQQLLPIFNTHGEFLTVDKVKPLLFFSKDFHTPVTSLLLLENTINGSVHPIELMRELSVLAKSNNMIVHLDGARLWNASTASGVSLKDYGNCADSVSVCLSKGLGAPIGSVLVGTKEFIGKARQYRKLYGGGMRQTGYLAAAGLFAITHHWPLQQQVHDLTKRAHAQFTALGFNCTPAETNMIWIHSKKLEFTIQAFIDAVNKLQESAVEKVRLDADTTYSARIVFHLQTDERSLARLVELSEQAIKSLRK